MKTVINEAGQKRSTCQIRLKKDTEMRNRANDGLEPWDRRWKQPSSIIVEAGMVVEYERLETRTGLYHTVTFRCQDGIFYACKKTDDRNYGN